MVTPNWYTALVGLVAVERLVELFIARRNLRQQLARGGVEYGARHYPVMVALHTGLLVGCLLETWLLNRPFLPWLGIPMVAVLLAAQGVRYWVVAELGRRWTTRVVVVPGEPLVRTGPYRFFRHPNYAAVVAEGIALPLIHTNWMTAIAFAVGNGWLLMERIRVENAALGKSRALHA